MQRGKGLGEIAIVAILSPHKCLEEPEENHEFLQSQQEVIRVRTEPGTCRMSV